MYILNSCDVISMEKIKTQQCVCLLKYMQKDSCMLFHAELIFCISLVSYLFQCFILSFFVTSQIIQTSLNISKWSSTPRFSFVNACNLNGCIFVSVLYLHVVPVNILHDGC
jgi:hypothetical protein